jgi:uncharacterized repeat protein (TIGR03803 family)
MTSRSELSPAVLRSTPQWTVFALALLCALTILATRFAQAQTFTVLHAFTGGDDGASPYAGLTRDAAGNLYGTTYTGGFNANGCVQMGCGTIFLLKAAGPDWTLNPLYGFHFSDGAQPKGRVIFGPDGTLYGATTYGGGGPCYFTACGTVFNLRPPATVCRSVVCPWTETVLWSFRENPDGAYPEFGDLNFTRTGHLYGTTGEGGTYSNGVVFELARLPDGEWGERIDYDFTQTSGQGATPSAGVIFDSSGNMYTPTSGGGFGDERCGDIVQLSNSPSGWTETVLYTFACGPGGQWPVGGLIFDQAGNLYGTTTVGGQSNGGIVFELTPSNGTWIFNILYSFTGGNGPEASLTMDAAGNLYGTTYTDGRYANGTVFKLTQSNGSWTYTSLHDFTGDSDGGYPISNVTFDSEGNLYGTASRGGQYGNGVVWEITP